MKLFEWWLMDCITILASVLNLFEFTCGNKRCSENRIGVVKPGASETRERATRMVARILRQCLVCRRAICDSRTT